MSLPEWFESDDALLAELEKALKEDRRPDVVSMLMTGYDLVMLDLPKALVESDSVDGAMAAVRADGDVPRYLTLTFDDVELDLEVVGRRIVGHLEPPMPALVHLDQPPRATTAVDVDGLGTFILELGSDVGFRLRVEPTSGAAFATPWIGPEGMVRPD